MLSLVLGTQSVTGDVAVVSLLPAAALFASLFALLPPPLLVVAVSSAVVAFDSGLYRCENFLPLKASLKSAAVAGADFSAACISSAMASTPSAPS